MGEIRNVIMESTKGNANGVAGLDENGIIVASQLPSYVDDVLEYPSLSDFPTEGETGKIYVATSTNITYRWSGSTYVAIGSDLALGETSSTAYRGDRGKIAYDHSQSTHARTDATKVESSSTNGNIKINGTETIVYKDVELTQSEYDQLPESKKTNGITYFVTNGYQSVSGNPELKDIRKGIDGHIYSSAGDAVRTQIDKIYGDVFSLQEDTLNPIKLKSINHRGYNSDYAENTITAFIQSKLHGYDYVETDVAFTQDNVPVLIHDSTINRTSNGQGNVSELSLSAIRQFDFMSWKNTEVGAETIPTLKEFIYLCRQIQLYPYIELKSNNTYSAEQIKSLVDIVKEYNMNEYVSWISFNIDYLSTIGNYDNNARLGLLQVPNADRIETMKALRSKGCDIFFDCNYTSLSKDMINLLKNENIPLEVWTVNDNNVAISLDHYISGITTDSIKFDTVLYNKGVTMKPLVGSMPDSDDGDDERTDKVLEHNWVFATNGLTDVINGTTITTYNNCSVANNGNLTLHYESGSGQYIKDYAVMSNVWGYNKYIEVDVDSCTMTNTPEGNARFIMFSKDSSFTEGLVFRKASGNWQLYLSSGWNGEDVNLGTVQDISGKTIGINIDSNGYAQIFVDGVSKYVSTIKMPSTATNVAIGSSANSMYGLQISAIRIYRNE